MSNKNCTYTFTNGQGQKQTIMGLSSMKAFLVDGGLDLFYPSGRFPWLSTESAIDIIQPGPVERRPQRIGSSRYSRVSVIPGINTQADANAQNKVVAYMNGDISRTTLLDYLSASGLPQEKIIAFTQRMQDDAPSLGEIKAMLDNRNDLDAMFDDVLAEEMAKDEAAKPAPQSKPKASKPRSTTSKPRSTAAKPPRTAGQAAASAAKNTASALANAIDGLGALFGGGGKFNSGLSFDEDTYAKAKPLFQAAIANLGEAGQDLREAMRAVVRMVLDKFGAQAAQNMKPYVVRFVSDVQNGNINGENNDESQVRLDGPQALEGMAPEQGRGAQGAGGVGGRNPGGSQGGNAAGGGADADGVSAARGGRGGTTRVRTSGAGAGGRKRRGSDRAGEAGSGVPGDDARGNADSAGSGAAGLIEPPAIPAVNYRITADTRLGVGGEIEKFNDNIEAIKTLKRIESDDRRATPQEQRILARYVGWGGLANAFPDPGTGQFKDKWQARGELLRSLLTKQEYDNASNSTIAAHYTSETVVKAMWDAAARLGFKGGLTLEDSMGSGNFIGLMPEGMDARMIGVELDSLTARIAQALYPQSTVLNSGFEKVPVPDNAFALNIGNPPFSNVSLNFQFKPDLAGVSMHNQFFRAGMDALRPGGLQIKVVSRYLMDAQDKSTRLALASKARLLGVIRLPDTAFKENARTEVITDIVILQKLTPTEQAEMDLAIAAYKDRGDKNGRKTQEQQALAARVPSWVETTLVPDPLGGEPMRINSYLASRPQNIMGVLERSGSMRFQNDVTVRLDNPERLGDMLAEAVARLPERVHSLDAEVAAATEERFKSLSDALRIALANEEIGHLKIDEDGVLQRVIERETPEGGYELSRQAITPSSPWSPQLSQDAQGRWYRLVAKVDADGNTVKEIGKDGKLSKRNVYEREVFQSEQDVPDGLRLGETAYARLRSIVGLRNLLKAQLVMETEDVSSEEMEANRAKLAEAYQVFVAEHGPVNRPVNLNLAMTMPDGGLVTALEVSYQPARTEAQAKKSGLPAQDEMATPAPIMRERVVPKYEPATTAGTAADALAIVLSETGRVDIERIAALRDLSQDDVVAELQAGDTPLVFKNPETNQYETADVYLSGMVKRKIKAAQAAGLEINVRALEAVQPEPWTAENVTVSLGANWVPVDVYADFVNHLTGGMARVSYSPLTNAFSLTNRGEDRAKHEAWSSEGAPVEYLIQRGLNSQSANVTYKDSDGNTRIDRAATDLANLKLKEIKAAFADWVFADTERRERLVAINNDLFNTRVTRQHNGQHLKLPGKVPDAILKMRRHQLNAIWRGIYERFMLIDHAVGAGKTFTGIARAMERRRMGLSKKPMIVVPNHLVEQWAADVYRLYPGAKVLAAGKKDFEVKNRRRLLGKIATGDWDIVIMPHSSFGGIGVSPETERRYLEEELQLALQAVKDAEGQAKEDGADTGWRKPFGVKMAEALVTKIRGRMERLNAGVRDRLLTFEQLGVDDLTVDEAHEFKNLYYSSKLTKVRGMGDQGGSRKANDLYNKVRVLRDSPTGSVTFMTGTPISNSAVEMFTMMRYLAADSLKEMGLENFDAWRTQFVEHTTAFEPTETGSLKEVARLGRTWSNMRGLMELYYQFTDAVSLEDIQRWYSEDNGGKPFPVPKLKGGDRQLVKIKPTQAQEAFLKEIIAGFDGLPGIEDPDERNAERLRLMDRARKVSLDVRAIDPTNPSKEEGGKLDAASQNIKRIYDQYNGVRGTQLVFLDRSVPKSKGDDKILKEYDELLTKRDEALAIDDEDAFSKVAEALEKFDSNEMESLRAAQAGGWNAYQQLKDNLVAMGIPANEIRFIQEANTDEQKLALFDAVNGGKVRVLIGSTPRMGAGTNVQKRAVALHHIDVTWKPSDIEQREGRVIRQGNLFATPPTAKEPNPLYRPDFEVEIIAYATERTVDAKMWDLNATKLKTINGIRKYDGSFTMDFEDSDSVSMAEMAALASGNPLLLERVKLESEISNLELQERAHRRKMYGALDALRTAEEAIRNNPERIVREEARVKDAAQRVQALQERAEARRVTIEGQEYRDRFAAAKAIREAIEQQQNGDEKAKFSVSINGKRYSGKESTIDAMDAALGDVQPFEMTIGDKVLIQRTAAGREVAAVLGQATVDMTGELTTEMNIGEVMGLKLVAGIRRFSTSDGMMLDVDLSAVNAIGQTIASEQLPTNPSGTVFNTTTVKNSLDRLFASMVADSSDHKLNRLISQLQYAKEHIEEYRQKADQPFPGAEDIKAKRDRLKEVVSLLDGSAAPVVDVAPALVVERWNPGQPRYMQPAFSRAAGSRAGMAQQQAQSVVNAIRARWANAPEVVVAADMNDTAVPQEVRDYDAKQRSLGAKGELEGFWHDGKVYIVAGTLRTPGDVARVLFHESLGHYGLRGVFGDGLKPLLLDLANKRRAELVAKAREYGLVPKSLPKNASVAQTYSAMSEQQRAEAAEELLAVLAQTKPELGFVKRAIAAIRTWLRKNVPMLADMKLTDDEIIQQFILPARAFVERGTPSRAPGGSAALSRARTEFAETERRAGGPDAYIKAFEAGGTVLTYRQWVQVRTPSFKRWWGYDWENAGGRDAGVGGADGVRPEDAGTTSGMAGMGGQDTQNPTSNDSRGDWKGSSFLDERTGEPRVFRHGTKDKFTVFDVSHPNKKDKGWLGAGHYFTSDLWLADHYSRIKRGEGEPRVMDVFVRPNNPRLFTAAEKMRVAKYDRAQVDALTQRMKDAGYGGAVMELADGVTEVMTFDSTGIKSATDNSGDFDPTNPDIRFSRAVPPLDNDPEQAMAAAGSTASGFSGLTNKAVDALNDHFGSYPGKLSWWHKTVGSMYNLAERSPAFKRVFDAAQAFINDVSYYGTEAANLAPKILPKLETWRDMAKTPISAEDNQAIAAPIFEGTLSWARDGAGNPVRIADLEGRYAGLTSNEKAQMLLRKGYISEDKLKAWRANPLDFFDAAVENQFNQAFLTPGIVWTPAELKSMFELTDDQIGLYQEFRAATDLSLDNMAKADMLRYGGKDVADLRDAVMEAGTLDDAAEILRGAFMDLSNQDPARSDELVDFANGIVDRAEKVRKLKKQGYAPLSRFGQYSVDVVVDGERQYFSLFESEREAKKMAKAMQEQYGAENVSQGTMSEEEFKLFQGITPETLELFGNALGLDSTGNEAQDQVFQAYLKLTKNNRSAMKRLMHRKGVAGYSEDVGRVLAAFVYSNARQTSAALHIGELGESVNAIPKGQGELKDAAIKLSQYIKEPREEAHRLRGFLFAQYLGGSIASAMVNFTQPLAISIPYLSQFGGLGKATVAWSKAMKDMSTGADLEPDLARALKVAEEQGTVSPQEVHQLMAQARGMSTLKAGDGTRAGDARAAVGNGIAKLALGWGKLFGFAEQVNRRSTFIAAYRLAVENRMTDPAAFATKAVNETQFINNKANKMRWGRGPIGATLMTFKSYSLNWLELVHRLATQNGADGKLAAAYMVGALLLLSGTGGLPFADDLDDLIDGLAQRLGYNVSSKKAKQEFLEDIFGKAGAGFIMRGITGIPGAPVDIAVRMGMGNLLPGTGLFVEKRDHTRDVMEIAGPAGDFITRVGQGLNELSRGNATEAALAVAPKAVSNAVKGADMLNTDMYRDTRGRKVVDTSTSEAISKLIGFQPASVSNVQEAAYLGQRAKDFYSLRKQEISAQWAKGIFEKDPEQIAAAKQAFKDWNAQNPGQRMAPDMPGIVRRVREMRKSKLERVADTSPKGMREMLRRDFSEVQ